MAWKGRIGVFETSGRFNPLSMFETSGLHDLMIDFVSYVLLASRQEYLTPN